MWTPYMMLHNIRMYETIFCSYQSGLKAVTDSKIKMSTHVYTLRACESHAHEILLYLWIDTTIQM